MRLPLSSSPTTLCLATHPDHQAGYSGYSCGSFQVRCSASPHHLSGKYDWEGGVLGPKLALPLARCMPLGTALIPGGLGSLAGELGLAKPGVS